MPPERRPDVTGVNPEVYRAPGGFQGRGMCGVAYPGNPDPELEPDNYDFHFCRRLPHHDGSDHSAFTFSIKTPETWPDERVR